MALLASNFIILCTVLHQTIYVNKPSGTSEAFICIDQDGLGNDTWPTNWSRLYLNGAKDLFQFYIPKDVYSHDKMNYKIRLVYDNRSYGDTPDWRSIVLHQRNITQTKNNYNPDHENVGVMNIALLWFIAASCLLLLFNLALNVYSNCKTLIK